MNNKKVGSEFEQKLCQWFAEQGYWAHFLNPAPDGSQPFDIIVLQGYFCLKQHCDKTIAMAIDCKTLSDKEKRFPLNRLEDNQISAFELLNSRGIYLTYFAIQHGGIIYMIPSKLLICSWKNGEKSILMEDYNEYIIRCE